MIVGNFNGSKADVIREILTRSFKHLELVIEINTNLIDVTIDTLLYIKVI